MFNYVRELAQQRSCASNEQCDRSGQSQRDIDNAADSDPARLKARRDRIVSHQPPAVRQPSKTEDQGRQSGPGQFGIGRGKDDGPHQAPLPACHPAGCGIRRSGLSSCRRVSPRCRSQWGPHRHRSVAASVTVGNPFEATSALKSAASPDRTRQSPTAGPEASQRWSGLCPRTAPAGAPDLLRPGGIGASRTERARGGGLEPPTTGPEPAVLPITPPPKVGSPGGAATNCSKARSAGAHPVGATSSLEPVHHPAVADDPSHRHDGRLPQQAAGADGRPGR